MKMTMVQFGFSIDETTNKKNRLVGNVVIGLLSEEYSKHILLHCHRYLEVTGCYVQ